MRILTLNYGSTNLKWALFEQHTRTQTGKVDAEDLNDLRHAVREVLDRFGRRVDAVVHRVVHGGNLTRTCLIDDGVSKVIEQVSAYSPIHNRRALVGIEALKNTRIPQVAVFDTAFHSTMPWRARAYALPRSFYERGLRRYGFHGISFRYLVQASAEHCGIAPIDVHGIFLHLGGGASACAVQGGQSVDTSMGLTPLEGLVMASRSGTVDPGLVLYLIQTGMSVAEVEELLGRRAGLTGVGEAATARDVIERAEAGDRRCLEAVELFTYRLQQYIGAYFAILRPCHLLVFSGGIGENSAFVRARTCGGLEHLGIAIDPERNRNGHVEITGPGASLRVLVLRTDEEVQMYREALSVLTDRVTTTDDD